MFKTEKKEKQNKKVVKDIQVPVKSVKRGQSFTGRVVSVKTPQTATVLVERKKTHRLYGKSFRRSKKYLVDILSPVSEGDVVEIKEIRPISKNKYFQLVKVIGKDIAAVVTERLKEEAQEEIADILPEDKEEQLEEAVEKNKKKGGEK